MITDGHGRLGAEMGRSTLMLLMAVTIFFGLAGSASATTYYISSSTGSDSNSAAQAQNKSTPWAHLPGMANATGAVASFSPSPGDTFVLKGCDVWTNSSFPVTWSWAGTSSSPITVGVDKTWYNTANCASGWNRPVWTACKSLTYGASCQGAVIGTANVDDIFLTTGNSLGAMYVTFDWIEQRDAYYDYDSSQSYGNTGVFACGYNDTNITLDHWYSHRYQFGGNPNPDSAYAFLGGSSGNRCSGTVFENGILDMTDATGCTANGTSYPCEDGWVDFAYWDSIKNSVIDGGIGTTLDSSMVEVGGNQIYNIHCGYDNCSVDHANCLEIVDGGTYFLHDNVIHDCGTGAESLEFGNPGETDYIWNNVWYNFSQNGLDFQQQSGTATAVHIWNNTIAPLNGLQCFEGTKHGGPTYAAVDIENNQCITTAANGDNITGLYDSLCGSVTTSCTIGHNVVLTPTVAADQGYLQTSALAFAPVNGNCDGVSTALCAIGAGANLASKWPSGYSTSDTEYGCTESAVSGIVESVCPARPQVGRPGVGAGAWDVGAFEFASVLGSGPAAPTSLTAIVQ
jgi:hypothetical protein